MCISWEDKLKHLLVGAQPRQLSVPGVFLRFKCAFLEDGLALPLKEFWIAESYFFGHCFSSLLVTSLEKYHLYLLVFYHLSLFFWRLGLQVFNL